MTGFVSRLVWVWPIFILSCIVQFGIIEGIALSRGGLTLSGFIWNLSEEWPLFIYIAGIVTGALAVHFWWHWAPPSIGQLGGTGG